MTTCAYKLGDWNCDNEALPEKKYCYWHLKTKSKKPTTEQLQELKNKNIIGVYLVKANLQKADLSEANLQEAELSFANLQKAELISANLQEADLSYANLQEAELSFAILLGCNLWEVNLHKSNLWEANLQEADLSYANLQEADLSYANLQKSNLCEANLQEADLSDTKLQGANLHRTTFNSKTNLMNSNLTGSNLYQSYFDVAKSFRNIEQYFENKGDKEINEIIGDALKSNNILRKVCKFSFINKLSCFGFKILRIKTLPLDFKPIVLNYRTINKNKPDVASKLHGKTIFRYADERNKLIFFDIYREIIINPENGINRIEFEQIPELTDCIFKDNLLQHDYLFEDKSDFYYEASYEVYNNLYNFYITNGRLDKAAEVHYRREDVNRKLRWEKGIWSKFRSIFDLLVIRGLTGYGDKIQRPFIFSFIIISLFAVLFKLTDGIIKTVNGNIVEPDWIDYFYHSITTFTSLGYSNIQPNLAIGHLPQILVSIESGVGIMMMALIIFVITYQVSR